jgi:hypothetical protein
MATRAGAPVDDDSAGIARRRCVARPVDGDDGHGVGAPDLGVDDHTAEEGQDVVDPPVDPHLVRDLALGAIVSGLGPAQLDLLRADAEDAAKGNAAAATKQVARRTNLRELMSRSPPPEP